MAQPTQINFLPYLVMLKCQRVQADSREKGKGPNCMISS